MEPREPRKRIKYVPKGVPVIKNALEFTKNKCSDHARKVFEDIEKIHIELWFDKHYHNRHQHGDEDGKREGIDPKTVEILIRKAIKHLLFYSSAVQGFKFVNLDTMSRPVRVILQEELNGARLNVVTETHFLDVNCYEVTVKTAMCTEEFRTEMGQYCIEVQGDSSILRRNDNKRMVEISSN